MKKRLRGAVFVTLLFSLFCGVAGAAENTETGNPSGIYDVVVEAGFENVVSFTPQRADGTAADITRITIRETEKEIYAEAVKLVFTYSGAVSGSQYLALVLDDEQAVPRDSNIAYIDQIEAAGQTVSFILYPKTLVNGKNYSVYLSSNAGTNVTDMTKVASFQYYAPYVLGDVNEDGKINATDATQILRYYNNLLPNALVDVNGNDIASRIQAADVNADGKINATDATQILRYYNGLKPNALENQ